MCNLHHIFGKMSKTAPRLLPGAVFMTHRKVFTCGRKTGRAAADTGAPLSSYAARTGFAVTRKA